VGQYRVIGLLGIGGMGEVFRARDSKLNRDVALKVLPSAFEFDPDRLARFRREAQMLAALNHPNIAAIYGLEESNGRQALVLELVEGVTLAQRIEDGPLPFVEALTMARQIAEALQAAHTKGIVHRDLKPANIKVTPAGVVKVPRLRVGQDRCRRCAADRGVSVTDRGWRHASRRRSGDRGV
jgi:serine/threonine-protein kinase